jgi:hypothetical protein
MFSPPSQKDASEKKVLQKVLRVKSWHKVTLSIDKFLFFKVQYVLYSMIGRQGYGHRRKGEFITVKNTFAER